MNYIKMTIEGNRLTVTEDTNTTAGSMNYDGCEFSFDDEWEGFTKTAVFSINGSVYYKVTLENDSCIIPSPCLENEGILQIGVFGINDDSVVITTNSIAHYVTEGIGSVGEWIEEDNNFVANAVKDLKSAAQEYFNGLTNRFRSEIERLDKIAGEPAEIYMQSDWYYPKTFTDSDDAKTLSSSKSTYEQFLNFKFKSLLADFPDYVTREELGTDSTGDNMLYAYSFTPKHYEKTILIACCFHSLDRSALISLAHFLDCLARDSDDDRVLKMLRDNVKIVVIPAVNPHGLNKLAVYNSNNVNLAFNFPYNWTQSRMSNKGKSAADQKETQLVMELLEKLSADKLCAVMELHTVNNMYSGRVVYYPRFQKGCATRLANFVNNFNRELSSNDDADEAIFAATNTSQLVNYAADTYGVDACQLVQTTNLYGGTYTNYSLTKYTEFIGNAILSLAKSGRALPKREAQPFLKHISWKRSAQDDAFEITAVDELAKMPISAYELKLDSPYLVQLSGYIELELSQSCTVKINPVLYQKNSPEQDFSTRAADTTFAQELVLAKGTHIIPIATVLQGFYSSYNYSSTYQYCTEVCFVLMLSASVSGAASVNSYAATLGAIPSEAEIPVEITSPIGLSSDYGSEDVPTQELKYPLGEFTDYEMRYFI